LQFFTPHLVQQFVHHTTDGCDYLKQNKMETCSTLLGSGKKENYITSVVISLNILQ